MATISVVPISWSGSAVVGGGTTVLHCNPGDEHALMTAFRDLVVTVAPALPSALQLTFPTAGVQVNDANGEVVNDWNDASPVSPVSGSAGVTYVNGVGLRVKWTTGAVHLGSQVVGSTFFVPLFVSAYEGSGNIIGSTITLFQGACATFVATATLIIWARPRPAGDGASFAVDGFNVPDQVSWLRSRRS